MEAPKRESTAVQAAYTAGHVSTTPNKSGTQRARWVLVAVAGERMEVVEHSAPDSLARLRGALARQRIDTDYHP